MRTRRKIDADRITVALLLLIIQHVGKPCPTHKDIVAQTGLPKRAVWRFLEGLRDRGVIDIEERGIRPGNWRRLCVTGGGWTEWTSREVKPRFPSRPPRRPGTASSGRPAGRAA
jgi:hypothetical protein